MDQLSPPTIKYHVNLKAWWLTALLISINVALFLWQISTGVDAARPSIQDAITWGADYAPLSFLAEPIRLFSSMFFHFGLIHLMLNMWALYLFGNIAEQMFGRIYFFGLYILAGLMGSLLSGFLDLQNSLSMLQNAAINAEQLPKVGAGASGAVMGLGAALTIISLLPVLQQQRFILDKKTLIMVMGINLFIGFMTAGINNAAHIGGMLMGAFLGLAWYIATKWKKNILMWLGLISALLLCGALYSYCLVLLEVVAPLWQELLTAMRQQFNF
jgi:rhomboid protease GluP